MDQPGKVANPARGQLKTGKMIFSCPRACLRIWSRETGSAVPSRVSLLISILRLNLGVQINEWAPPRNSRRNPVVVVVVVVFTLTNRASTIPSNIRGCQSGTWTQRGTKVNGSHHGDNPLLRPTGIKIATKSYATLQAMAPTNSKTVHQTLFAPY